MEFYLERRRHPKQSSDARLEIVVLGFRHSRQDQAGCVSPQIGADFSGPTPVVPWHSDGNVHGRKLSRASDQCQFHPPIGAVIPSQRIAS